MLGFIGGTATISLFGCLRRQSASVTPPNSSTQAQAATVAASTCVVRPEQTEGPYFVDEKLNRSDIRSDPADGSVKQGVPLRLIFQVTQVNGRACTPLNSAIVDIWHCDAEGIYSDVNDRRFNTVGQKFLRGYQVTNANGTSEFIVLEDNAIRGTAKTASFKMVASNCCSN